MSSPVVLPRRSTVALAACLCLAGIQAHAQSAAEPAAAASAPDDNGQIQRVVVTAQKRPQFAEKVPMSLSAVSQETLDKQGAVDIQDLSRITPGLSARATTIFGNPNIAVRGISSTAGSATTAIYIDDAPIQVRGGDSVAGGTAYPRLFDLDRVEVLRGPQGTLFGSGAEGGAIRFITPVPRSDKFSGNAKAGISMTDGGETSYESGIAVGGPIAGDTLAFRASAYNSHDGGWIDHVSRETGASTDTNTNGVDTTVARVALLWRPTSALTVAPSFFYQDRDEQDRSIYYEDAGVNKTFNHVRQPTHDRFSLSSLSVNYEFDSFSVKSVTSLFDRTQHRIDDYSYALTPAFTGGSEVLPGDPDFTGRNFMNTSQNNLTEELRFSSNDDGSSPWNWTVGVYGSRARQVQSQFIDLDLNTFTLSIFGVPPVVIFGVPADGNNAFLEHDTLRDRDIALFGETTYEFTPATSLTVGLRDSHNEFGFDTTEGGPLGGGGVAFGGSQKGHALLPKVALSHELTKSDLVYASASRGNRVGGANPSYAGVAGCGADLAALGLTDVPRTYDGDFVWSYELGYKSRMLDQTLEVAASVFTVDWTGIQQRVTLPTCHFGYTSNMGKARSRGGDLQLQLRATKALLLSASVSYTDSYFTKTAYAPDGGSSGTGTPLVVGGEKLPIAPVNVAVGAEYGWAPTGGTHAFVRGDYQYANAYKSTGPVGAYDYDAGTYNTPATNFFSLHGGLSVGKVDFQLAVDNLFNSKTELLRTHNSIADPSYQAATFRPRTIGFTTAVKF
jgi:iron complex outermembrane receptor protein